jgi:hypothetical protein
MKGDIATLDSLIPLSEFLTGTRLPGDVVVLMHSTENTCPQVGDDVIPILWITKEIMS